MPSQTPPRSKRKKRRLKKQVRIGLMMIGAFLIVLTVSGLVHLFTSSNDGAVTAASEPSLEVESTKNVGETIATILIDPGHGGYDSGKLPEDGSDIYEKDINLEIALKVKAELERINPNLEVLLTRDSDEVPWPADEVDDLTYRENLQTKLDADYFLSLHCNADDYSTTEGYIFFIKPNDTASLALSRAMKENFEAIGWSSLHSINTTELLQVVTNAKIPSILLEMGFMTNENDFALLMDEKKTDQLATAIAKAYSDYIMAHYDAGQSSSSNKS